MATYNVVSSGKMEVHDSTVFLYGYQGAQFFYRSTDNGSTWTNIADKFPDRVIYVHSHGSEVFAIVEINGIYLSTDGGANWTLKNPKFAIESVHAFHGEFFWINIRYV